MRIRSIENKLCSTSVSIVVLSGGFMKVLIVMDPLKEIKIAYDSTYAIIQKMELRSYKIWVCNTSDLSATPEGVRAKAVPLTLKEPEQDTNACDNWFQVGAVSSILLQDFDCVLMRKDPPFDMEYIFSTYMLEYAKRYGARVVNNPVSVRNYNEKFSILEFQDFLSPTIVTRSAQDLRRFVQEHGEAVFKPLDGMGGCSVFRVSKDDPNVSVIIETMNQFGARSVMAQKYIADIDKGDKRVLIIGGKVVPYCLARIPQLGEFRGNLSAGGKGVAQLLSARDRQIAELLAPVMMERGLFLVGLDIIGDFLTEINVTSPTGFRQIQAQTPCDVSHNFIVSLENVLEDF